MPFAIDALVEHAKQEYIPGMSPNELKKRIRDRDNTNFNPDPGFDGKLDTAVAQFYQSVPEKSVNAQPAVAGGSTAVAVEEPTKKATPGTLDSSEAQGQIPTDDDE